MHAWMSLSHFWLAQQVRPAGRKKRGLDSFLLGMFLPSPPCVPPHLQTTHVKSMQTAYQKLKKKSKETNCALESYKKPTRDVHSIHLSSQSEREGTTGRKPCCSKEGMNRGAWTALEDKILVSYIKTHGERKWRSLAERAGEF